MEKEFGIAKATECMDELFRIRSSVLNEWDTQRIANKVFWSKMNEKKRWWITELVLLMFVACFACSTVIRMNSFLFIFGNFFSSYGGAPANSAQ